MESFPPSLSENYFLLSFCSVISFADPLIDFYIKVRSELCEESVNAKWVYCSE